MFLNIVVICYVRVHVIEYFRFIIEFLLGDDCLAAFVNKIFFKMGKKAKKYTYLKKQHFI